MSKASLGGHHLRFLRFAVIFELFQIKLLHQLLNAIAKDEIGSKCAGYLLLKFVIGERNEF